MVFKVYDAKCICLRMTPAQHEDLAVAATKAGQSLNTYVLRKLGLKTPFEQTAKPRGRKLETPLRVSI